MSLNIELLRKAVEWAETEAAKGDSGSWNQDMWARGPVGKRALIDDEGIKYATIKVSCGTSFCVAGNVCAIQGDRFVLEDDDWLAPDMEVEISYVMPKGSKEVHEIQERATDLLGLEYEEAQNLFYGDNSIEDIRRIAKRIARDYGCEL